MIPAHLDFKRLKRRVSIEQVLSARGWMERMRRRGGRLVGPCPVHGGDNPTAFVVREDRQLWHCFSACGRGGDVVELLRLLDDLSYAETANALAHIANSAPAVSSRAHKPPTPQPRFQPFTRRLPLDPYATLLAEKLIAADTARTFDAGTWRGPGFLRNCVAVRLHDPSGQPLGYAGRRLSAHEAAQFGKWRFPPRLPKSRILFNNHRIIDHLETPLIIVECPWGVMRLAQLGLPAVALLGLHLSREQRRLLERWRDLVLLLDGDAAGRRATRALERDLSATHAVRTVQLDDGLDPDDLDDRELLQSILPSWPSCHHP
ncbi:MAG: hypothetical protein GY946_05300 [bacterium]|nr:hypothetical protein [bacterium]